MNDAVGERNVRLAQRNKKPNDPRVAVKQPEAKLSTLETTTFALDTSASSRIGRPIRVVGQSLKNVTNRTRRLMRWMQGLPFAVARNGGLLNALAKLRDVLRYEGLASLKRKLTRLEAAGATGRAAYTQSDDALDYSKWVQKYDTINDDMRAKIGSHIARMPNKPLFSVVMPVYNPYLKYLDKTIRSVTAQLYPNWELCIADDASTDPGIRSVIDHHATKDSRIKVVYRNKNGHISRATNSALELARGEFVAFLDHDDVLAAHALYWIAAELEAHPRTDILYSDSDFVDDNNRRFDPYFKPDLNLELMLGHNLVSHLGAYRRSLVEAVGGMRIGLEGSQDYDLLLRVLGKSDVERVRHVPAILYHWRKSNKAPTYSARHMDRCVAAARKAIKEFLANSGVKATVVPAPSAKNWQRIRYDLPEPAPNVSIIIPTKNQPELLEKCARGVLNDTDYPLLEVAIIDHDSDDPRTKALFKEFSKDSRVRIMRYSGPFNYSAIINFAVDSTEGEVLAFLNNDIEITHADWIREMVSHVARPDIGAVGAKLFYPNGNIQHAGVVLGMGGVAGHQFCQMPHNYPGPNGETILVREVSSVTGACMLVRRSAFVEAGGFDAINLPVAFNDIDFCLRLRERGYRNIFTPFAQLVHHESASRGTDFTPERLEEFERECEYMIAKWGGIIRSDPFFNPNLSLELAGPKFADPPRGTRPWETPA